MEEADALMEKRNVKGLKFMMVWVQMDTTRCGLVKDMHCLRSSKFVKRNLVPCIEGLEEKIRRPEELKSETVVVLLNDPMAFECVNG